MSRTSPFFLPQKEIDIIDSMNEELIDEIVGQSVDIYKVNIERTEDNIYGESLKSEGREEKGQLLEELKEFLESVSLTEKSKAEQETAEAQQSVLNKAPLKLYIG